MKKYILSALMLLAGMGVSLAQQTVAGTTYFLPKTALRFAVKVHPRTVCHVRLPLHEEEGRGAPSRRDL